MKRFLLAALLLTGSLKTHAQITLEHEYAQIRDGFYVSAGTVKYINRPGADNVVQIHNADHSLYRTFTAPAAAGYKIDVIDFLSEKLFNTDASLEMIIYYYKPDTDLTMAKIVDETGGTLLTIEGGHYAEVFNTAAGTKLVAYLGSGSSNSTKVYALPGKAVLSAKTSSSSTQLAPYPNPSATTITLPYDVAQGQQGELEILDMTGRVVKQYHVSSTFTSLLVQSRDLHSGVYTYRVTTRDGVKTGRRFVVSR